jgi:hypothetical protein
MSEKLWGKADAIEAALQEAAGDYYRDRGGSTSRGMVPSRQVQAALQAVAEELMVVKQEIKRLKGEIS